MDNPKTPNRKEKQMARGKAINVKIATTKVIKALETKLDQIKKDKAKKSMRRSSQRHKKSITRRLLS